MASAYFKFAYNLFGDFYYKRSKNYYSLRQSILNNRMDIGYDMYMSGALLASIICALMSLLGLQIIMAYAGVPDISGSRINFPEWTANYVVYKPILIKVIGSILVAGSVFAVVYRVFMAYPAIMAGDRKRNIEQLLPYAINYMSAMSGAGVLPLDLFRSLAKNEIYGEMAVEMRYFVRDIEILGYNLVTGMKNVAVTTPSVLLQDFMQGAITVVTSGGELENYFNIKAEQYLVENRQRQKEFLETLGLLGETYVTAFVAGPLFLIIMVAVMSIMGSSNLIFLYLLIYAVIPIGSMMFIVLVSIMTPEA
ncbi:MAG: type II secretion system F family protein [Methanosarcinaceae archaeon]|nr:type II secretion system F family protein [Methanosarcinaceae archaeon]